MVCCTPAYREQVKRLKGDQIEVGRSIFRIFVRLSSVKVGGTGPSKLQKIDQCASYKSFNVKFKFTLNQCL